MFASKTGIEVADIPTLTKHDIRSKVWDYIEVNDLANFPRPVNHRIPNFKGAGEAAQSVRDLQCFTAANTVKVNPDKPQEDVRFHVLEAGKTLLMPTPRLRSGLFNRIDGNPSESKETLRAMANTEGMKKFSQPVDLEAKVKVDLIVLGSVAVSRAGRRIGKGEGYADMEYGMMKAMNAVDDNTLVVTSVHDCQVFETLPERLFGEHDVPVDFIVTPTEVFQVSTRLSRPEGIYWKLLAPEKLKQIPILKVLRDKEEAAGKDVTLGELTEEQRAAYNNRGRGGGRGGRGDGRGRGRGRGGRVGGRTFSEGEGQKNIQDGSVTINVSKKNRIVKRTVEATDEQDRLGSADLDNDNQGSKPGKFKKPYNMFTYAVFIGKIAPACRVRELKEALQERDVRPMDVTWRGRTGFAFLRFVGPVEECDDVLAKLEGLKLQNQLVRVQRAKEKTMENEEDGEKTIMDKEALKRKRQLQRKPRIEFTYGIFVGKVPPTCRVRELKVALQDRDVQPVEITWRGRSGFAFLRFTGPVEECDSMLAKLEGLSLQDQPVLVQRAKDKSEEHKEDKEEEHKEDKEEGEVEEPKPKPVVKEEEEEVVVVEEVKKDAGEAAEVKPVVVETEAVTGQ